LTSSELDVYIRCLFIAALRRVTIDTDRSPEKCVGIVIPTYRFTGLEVISRLNLFFFLSFLKIVQIVVWRFLQNSEGSDVLATKQALFFIVLLQYFFRFLRILPLTSELKRTAGVFAETAWAGAACYLLLYMLASHVSS
jgi:hypothetical protein